MAAKNTKFKKISAIFLQISLAASLLIGQSNILKPQTARAGGLEIKSVDVMKWTKDTMANQPSDAQINNIVGAIVAGVHPTHIAVSMPLDPTSDYPPAFKPAPRSAEDFTQAWADAIHKTGTKVLWRDDWAGLEGIYGFQDKGGANRFPAGTAASAATDGDTTWLGKTYDYIINHPALFEDGDVWAPMPESTNYIFNDSTAFLGNDGPGVQANYAQFFIDVQKVSAQAFAKIGKNVITGLSTNNFTEVQSGWLPQSLFDSVGMTVVDHYGARTPQQMDSDLRFIYKQRGQPVFLQEWGDYWNAGLDDADRAAYLQSMYAVFQKLVDDGVLVGFNYWGAWANDGEGILTDLGNGQFQVNSRGLILANFFGTAPAATPAPAPPPPPQIQSEPTSPPPAPMPPVQAAPIYNQTPPPNPSYRGGALIKIGKAIFVVSGGEMVPFTSMSVFTGLGYSLKNVIETASAGLPTAGYILDKASAAHLPGSWILNRGTVYYVSGSGLIGVPNMQILANNGGSLAALLKANAADIANIKNSAPSVMALNDSRVR